MVVHFDLVPALARREARVYFRASHVTGGPYTSSTGRVDFIDEEGNSR
jgi:hypothetical protein